MCFGNHCAMCWLADEWVGYFLDGRLFSAVMMVIMTETHAVALLTGEDATGWCSSKVRGKIYRLPERFMSEDGDDDDVDVGRCAVADDEFGNCCLVAPSNQQGNSSGFVL